MHSQPAVASTSDDDDAAVVKGVWDIATDVRRAVEVQLQGEVPLTFGGFIGSNWSKVLTPSTAEETRAEQVTVSVSNWGVNAIQQQYKTPQGGDLRVLAMRSIINVAYHAHPVVLVTTTGGVLTLSVMTPTVVMDKAVANALLHDMMSSLCGLVGGALQPPSKDVDVLTLSV